MSRPRPRPETFAIVTFGCQMNRHDSERVAGLLMANGYREIEPGADPKDADLVLFNTCTVREGASERLRGTVASMASAKRRRPEMVVGVMGCLAQDEGRRLVEQLHHIDLVVGTHRLHALPSLIESAAAGVAVVDVDGSDDPDAFIADLPSHRESPSRAWIAIAQGCDNHCSYCIVPSVRGPERSRPIEEILAEAEGLAADGVLEVTLLGQNVNSYGRDRYGAPRFAELLTRIGAATDIPRVRFTTSHPKDLGDDVIEAIAETDAVCEHLHLPAQSGDDRILQAMGRGYTAQRYLERVERLREAVPDIAISTDLMVAFPGETEEEFQHTVDLVRQVGFSQAFTFIFSPRAHTPAAELDDAIAREESRRRLDLLVTAVNDAALAHNITLEGSVQEVLVEGAAKKGEDRLKGRTRGGQTVILQGDSALPDTIVAARMRTAHTWFLEGEVPAGGG